MAVGNVVDVVEITEIGVGSYLDETVPVLHDLDALRQDGRVSGAGEIKGSSGGACREYIVWSMHVTDR